MRDLPDLGEAGACAGHCRTNTASLTFPRTKSDIAHLDDHYWARRRLVAGGILFVNVVVI